jgi:hypothetical protein
VSPEGKRAEEAADSCEDYIPFPFPEWKVMKAENEEAMEEIKAKPASLKIQ